MIGTPPEAEPQATLQVPVMTLVAEDNADVHQEAYDRCIAACPVCITRSCTLSQGHYAKHRCSEGHKWL